MQITRATFAFALMITLATGTSVYSAEKKAATSSKALQGEWKCAEVVEKGKTYKAPEQLLWVFADDKVTVLLEGRKQHTGTFVVEPSATPATIDMNLKGVTSTNVDQDIVAIYKLEKDRLTICTGVEDARNKRPKEFVHTKEFPIYLMILERVK